MAFLRHSLLSIAGTDLGVDLMSSSIEELDFYIATLTRLRRNVAQLDFDAGKAQLTESRELLIRVAQDIYEMGDHTARSEHGIDAARGEYARQVGLGLLEDLRVEVTA